MKNYYNDRLSSLQLLKKPLFLSRVLKALLTKSQLGLVVKFNNIKDYEKLAFDKYLSQFSFNKSFYLPRLLSNFVRGLAAFPVGSLYYNARNIQLLLKLPVSFWQQNSVRFYISGIRFFNKIYSPLFFVKKVRPILLVVATNNSYALTLSIKPWFSVIKQLLFVLKQSPKM